jgi:hypothetical protein
MSFMKLLPQILKLMAHTNASYSEYNSNRRSLRSQSLQFLINKCEEISSNVIRNGSWQEGVRFEFLKGPPTVLRVFLVLFIHSK